MSATRSRWRTLIAVLQAVMLVAFTGACPGHAHACMSPAAHVHTAPVDPAKAPPAAHAHDSAGMDARAGGDAAPGGCDLTCCHVTPVRCADQPGVAIGWTAARALTGLRAIAFDSRAPETLPEPPRTVT